MSDMLVKYHNGMEEFPLKKLEGSAGIDLYVAEDTVLKKGDFKLISMGVSIKLPKGTYAMLVPRSSTFKKYGLLQTNGLGVIDNFYSGNGDVYMMPVYATRDTEIKRGDRICQILITNDYLQEYLFNIVKADNLSNTNRGGFGSTDSGFEVRRWEKERII